MTKRITYDPQSALGYVRVVAEISPGMIKQTIDVEVNHWMMLDVDKKGRILGIELFGNEAHTLKQVEVSQPFYEKENNTYILRLQSKKVQSTFHHLGINFCFGNEDYTDLVELELVDLLKYKEEIL